MPDTTPNDQPDDGPEPADPPARTDAAQPDTPEIPTYPADPTEQDQPDQPDQAHQAHQADQPDQPDQAEPADPPDQADEADEAEPADPADDAGQQPEPEPEAEPETEVAHQADEPDDDEDDLDIWLEPIPAPEEARPRRSSRSGSSTRSSAGSSSSSGRRSSSKRRSSSRSSSKSSSKSSSTSSPRSDRTTAGVASGSRARSRTTDPVAKQQARRRRQLTRWATAVLAAAAAVAGAFAPASLTGDPVVDTVERAVFAGVVAYATAHGHRWSWFVGGALFLVPARGPALGLVAGALALSFWAATRPNRPKVVGAAIGGLLANAALWYTDDLHVALTAACAVAGATVLVGSGFDAMRSRTRRVTLVPLLAAFVLTVVGVLGVVVGGLLAASDLTAGTSSARQALTAVENGDTESARLSLESAGEHLDRADRVLAPATMAARLVPSLAQHVNALDVSLTESRRITRAADDLLATTDYDKLRYQGRIDVDQIADLAPGARHVHEVLADAAVRLEAARAAWLLPPLRDRVDELSAKVTDVSDASDLAADVLTVAPGLFGGEGDRRYLVVFLTPAELRGGGGFVGSYAELQARDGRLDLTESGPIRDLIYHGEFGERSISGPADYLRRYGRFQPADYIQDVTYSPNFPSNAQVLAELYPQAGGSEVDGVIGVDPAGLAAVLRLTGPVQVEGYDQELTADNAEELLLREQYVKFGPTQDDDQTEAIDSDDEAPLSDQDRKDFLAEATKATFEKLTSASLPAPAEIGRVLGPAARGRHLQVWSPQEAEQRLFERIDADSALDITRGQDGFEVAQHNAGNNKLDAYLRREIDYTATVDPSNGQLTGTLRITLHNEVPLPLSALPVNVWGNRNGAPGGTNVTWLSIFTPHQVTGATIDGKRLDLGAEEEVGLNAYDTPFFRIPQGETVTIELQLAGALDLSDGYRLRVVPQPVANPDRLTVAVRPSSGTLVGPATTSGAVRYGGELLEPVDVTAAIG